MGYRKKARKSASFVRLWSGVCGHPSFLPRLPPRPVRACDVHTPSCPPLSIHLHHSHPTPFLSLPMHLQSPPPTLHSLPPLTYLHLLSLPLYLSACSTHSFHPLSVRKTLLSLSLSPFFPHSIISPHMSASPLFFVTHFLYPTFFSTLRGVSLGLIFPPLPLA